MADKAEQEKQENDNPRQVKLSDGREVEVDLYKVTYAEVVEMTDPATPMDRMHALMGQVVGMKGEELAALPYPDYRRVDRAVFRLLKDPLGADPN